MSSGNGIAARVALVTGSNKGIGFGIVMTLCKKFDGIVYLTSRDEERGRKAVHQLNEMGLHPSYHQLDVDDESSVLKLRDHLMEHHGGLDVLVNNAGIGFPMTTPRQEYGKVARATLATNYFNVVRLCDILFPILRPHARVVNLSSDDGHLPRINGHEPEAGALRNQLSSRDLTVARLGELINDFLDAAEKGDYYERGWPSCEASDSAYAASDPGRYREPQWPNESYVVSKVAITALTRVQQRQFDQDPREDMTVNAAHPGYVITDMTCQQGEKTIEEGAESAAWLAMMAASSEDNQVPKGAYVWHDKQLVDWVHGPTPTVF